MSWYCWLVDSYKVMNDLGMLGPEKSGLIRLRRYHSSLYFLT